MAAITNKPVLAVAVFIILVINPFAYYMLVRFGEYIYQESGPIENLQVIAVIISGILFLRILSRHEKHQKFILLSCFLLCTHILLREIDVEDYDIPRFLIILGSGTGRNILLSIAWLSLIAYAGINYRYYSSRFRLYLTSPMGVLLTLCAAFVLVSTILDSNAIKFTHKKFYEEIIELNAYCMLLLSALASHGSLNYISAHRSHE